MKNDWIKYSIDLARSRADFFSGARKIIRGHSVEFTRIKNDLTMADCGFTKSKSSMLRRNYLHSESINAAVMLWEKRKKQDKYGSVGFTTYNHFVKGDVKGATPRGSVFGPCIQSVCITYLKRDEYAIDVFYRTTEWFKKFPADLVFLRDELLAPFNLDFKKVKSLTFHFANITMHPMYFVTIIPHLDDPIAELERIKKADRKFYDWIVKWTARYLIKKYEHGILKFAQALRVQMDAKARIDTRTAKKLSAYLEKNHPGYTRTRFGEDGEDEEEA